MMHKNGMLHSVSLILLLLGGLNWLLIGLFGSGIEAYLGGMEGSISRILFILIGLAAVYEISSHKHRCKSCEVKTSTPQTNAPEGS